MNAASTITGFDELMKAMDELSQEITKGKTARIWTNSMRYAFIPVKETAQMLLQSKTHGTGTLADSLYISVHKPQARDKNSQSYFGETYMARVSVRSERPESKENVSIYTTKTGKVVERKYIAFRGSNRPVALAVEFGTAEVPARSFLRTALSANLEKVQQRLGDALWRELTYGKYAKEAGKDFTGSI